jgi:hypothetical protein
MTLAGLGVAATVFWFLWGADSTTRSSDFVSTPQAILWVLILCALSAFLVLAALPVTATVWRLISDLRSQSALGGGMWLSLAVGLTVLAGLFAFPLYVRYVPWSSTVADEIPKGDEWPLWRQELKLTVYTAANLLVAFLTIGGIWLVGIALARMKSEIERNELGRFFALRDDFTLLLAIGAGLLGLTMFATAALRSAVIAVDPTSGYDFGFIIAFGLWFSGLLGIACAPTYVALRGAGSSLVDTAYPLPAGTDTTLTETLERRQALERLLGLSLTASVVVRAGAALASPFIGSLVGLLIPD